MREYLVAPDPDPHTMDLADAAKLVEQFMAPRAKHLGEEVALETELPRAKPQLLSAILRLALAAKADGRPEAFVNEIAPLTVDVQSFVADGQAQTLQACWHGHGLDPQRTGPPHGVSRPRA